MLEPKVIQLDAHMPEFAEKGRQNLPEIARIVAAAKQQYVQWARGIDPNFTESEMGPARYVATFLVQNQLVLEALSHAESRPAFVQSVSPVPQVSLPKSVTL